MAGIIDKVAEVNPSKETWCLQVRVVRLWSVPSFGSSKLPYSIEMVLLDENGGKIHASVRKTLVFRFFNLLKEGEAYEMSGFGVGRNVGNFKTTRHEYRLNFENSIIVRRLDNPTIPSHGFSFVKVDELMQKDFDNTYLVDVIGMLSGVGIEKEHERDGKVSKYNVIELQIDGAKLECCLWGTYVDHLNNFLASGDVANAVVIIQFARAKQFRGNVSLQNSMYCTKVFYNLDVPVALEFKNNVENIPEALTQLMDGGSFTLEEDFLQNHERKTIEELKDCKEDCICVVLATVSNFVDSKDWWYTACKCNRVVHPYSRGFLCEACNVQLLSVTPRYKIKLRIFDDCDSCSVVIFDKEGTSLLKKSCEEIVQPFLKCGEDPSTPAELTNIIDKTFLFKIEVKPTENPNFEPSYRVKRMTDDITLIEKFKVVAPPVVEVDYSIGSIANSKSSTVLIDVNNIKGKNLLSLKEKRKLLVKTILNLKMRMILLV